MVYNATMRKEPEQPPNGGARTGETTFRGALRAYRRSAGLSLEEFGKRIKKSTSYVSGIELGDFPVPDAGMVDTLSKALRLNEEQTSDFRVLATIDRNTISISLNGPTDANKAFVQFVTSWGFMSEDEKEPFRQIFEKYLKEREDAIRMQAP